MKSVDSSDDYNEYHTGHVPETGILARVREWTDVLPWLRLGRVMRMAGSPPLLFLVAVTSAVWWAGLMILFGSPWSNVPVVEEMSFTQSDSGALAKNLPQTLAVVSAVVFQMMPSSVVSQLTFHGNLVRVVSTTAWSLFVWLPTVMVLIRQGALLTAGRTMADLRETYRMAIRRSFRGWLVTIVPIVCACAFGLLILMWGAISRLVGGLAWLEFPLAVIIAILGMLCGVLLFGAYVAVPLGWAALINEKDPDPLDSLSRGYEYLYRRPLSLVLYMLVSLIAISVIGCLAAGISISAAHVTNVMLLMVGSPQTIMATSGRLILLFPFAAVMTLFWGLVGGVYLLMRRDANGQEVEDIWQPSPAPEPPLPELPRNEDDS